MNQERERIRRMHKFRQMLVLLIVVLLFFVLGVITGRLIEKKAAAMKETEPETEAAIEETMEEPVTEEPVTEAQGEEPSTETVSGNSVSGNSVSGNGVSENSLSQNQADLPKPAWNFDYVKPADPLKLEDKAAIRSSFDETMALNLEDKNIIANSTLDFSNMRIACLGDSITQGMNGATPYPTYLQEILGAKEVLNLGIGGSTICSSHAVGVKSMAERMDEIPEGIDLTIVIGGTNDNFSLAEWQFGFLYWDSKGDGTFCGDMQLLMRRFKWIFPDMRVIFFTPPSNVKIDELKAENPSLLDEARYAEATDVIGAQEGMPVVDLYNQNFLNAHDKNVMSTLMSDSVHPNSMGNKILAERVASEIIRRYK